MVNYSLPSLFFTLPGEKKAVIQTCVSDSGCCHGSYPDPRVFNSAAMEFSAQRLPFLPFSEPGCDLAWLEGCKFHVPGGRSSRAWWQGHPHCSWCWLKGLALSMHGVLRALNVPCCRKLKLGRGGIAAAFPVSGFICCSQLWGLGCRFHWWSQGSVLDVNVSVMQVRNLWQGRALSFDPLSGSASCFPDPRLLPKSS